MYPRILLGVSGALFLGFVLFSSAGGVAPAPDSSRPDADKQPVPQLATIKDPHISLSDALIDLAHQTSESASDQLGDPDPIVDLDLKRVPFWQALDALAEKANARVDLHTRDGVALVKRPAGWKPPPISHDGLFRSTQSAVTAKLDLETGASTYTAAVEVAWEPHLLPILLETRPQSLVVRDDAGRLLPASVGAGSSLAPVDGRISLPFDVTLPPPPRSVRSLSVLEGQLYAVAPTKMLTFTFDSINALAKAAPGDPRLSHTQEEVVCTVSRVVAAEGHWSMEITLDYPEGNVKLDSYQSWVVNNEMYLEHAGERFASSSYLLEESTPRRTVLTYNFSDPEKMKRGLGEWKLVYRTPALVVKVPFSFSFKDVPLP